MANLKELRGNKIIGLTADPSNLSDYEGQIWYNTTDQLLKTVIGSSTGVWTAGGLMNAVRSGLAGAGTQTAGLAISGRMRLYNGTRRQELTEEYDGSSWTAGGNLSSARINHSGAGTQTAGLAFGGDASPGRSSATEEYNGTSWTAGGNLSEAKAYFAGAGTQTAGLSIGGILQGAGGATSGSEEYNGSSWTAGGNMSSARVDHGGAGTQTAALVFGGESAGSPFPATRVDTNVTEEYNGTSWTSGGNMSTTFGFVRGFGTQTAALGFGNADTDFATSEEYNGSSWTAGGTLIAGRLDAGAGTQNAGLGFGNPSSHQGASTQEYTKSPSNKYIVSLSTIGQNKIY